MLFKTVVLIYLANVWSNVGASHCTLNDVISSGDLVFHDLTHEFDTSTMFVPEVRSFEFTKQVAEITEYGWYAANEFEVGEHGGTHMDAPYHFYREGEVITDYTLENFILPLIIIDISTIVNGDPNFILYKHHLDNLQINSDGKPCMIIFNFGWSRFYGDKTKYLGLNETDETMNFPGLSEEIAEWLVTEHKNVIGVGVDLASLDPGFSKSYPVHKVLSYAGLYAMEHIKLDVSLPDYGCTGIAMPMKIARGTGAPLRLAALCPKSTPTDA